MTPSFRAVRRLYHRTAIDLSPVKNLEQRKLLQQHGLDHLTYPTIRIRRATGRRVPVRVLDLSRYNRVLRGAHQHLHNERGDTGHLLAPNRQQVYGLYWLPRDAQDPGSIEIESTLVTPLSAPIAGKTLIAELAHCVQYRVLTAQQLQTIMALFHDTPQHSPHGPSGANVDDHFEGHDDQYHEWPGETFMDLFGEAFAPGLAWPLGARWTHKYEPGDVQILRQLLR